MKTTKFISILQALLLAGALGQVMVQPAAAEDLKVKKAVAPEYPRGAERRGIEGYVVVKYTVTASGDVTNISVSEASPEGVFDAAAMQAVEQWKFEPVAADVADNETKINFKM